MQPEPTNHRILIVDDNRSIHDDFQSILSARTESDELNDLASTLLGSTQPDAPLARTYELDSAYQGEEALRMVESSMREGAPYSLAFVDMRMPPGWDGIKTIREIRKVDPMLQIVICTAYSDYSWHSILDNLGVSDWLVILKKPFDVVEVQQLACSLTEKRELTRQVTMRTEELEEIVIERSRQLEHANQQLQEQVESLANANARLAQEINARQKADQQIRHLAFHDSLTNLPNRLLLLERIDGCIERSKRNDNHKFAVLYCDVDNFKLINDSMGHRVGDQFLMQASKRLKSALRSTVDDLRAGYDTVARLGGDEFVILLDDIPDESHVQAIASRIRESMRQPITVDNSQITLSVSVGIATSGGEYDEATDLLRDADTALYNAKDLGKDRQAVFDQAMRDQVTERLDLEHDLRTAIVQGQFEVNYQPIILLADNSVAAVEALVRWRHPTRGLLSPAMFIPVAEETGMIQAIGEYVLDESLRQVSIWRKSLPGMESLRVSVNLSPRQLTSRKLAPKVENLLTKHSLPGNALALEITESASMDNLSVVRGIIDQLNALGISIYLDDFGTGYSSLSILHTLPFSTIKLDRSFVSHLDEPDYPTTIQAVVMIAKSDNLTVVAEGVETHEQLAQVRELECDYCQGYYFSKPLPPNDFEAYVASLPDPACGRQVTGAQAAQAN